MKCKDCPYFVNKNGYEGWCTNDVRNVVEPNDEACDEMNVDLDEDEENEK